MEAGNDSIWLSEADVERLTGKKRWSTQCRILAAMDVPFRPNAVGRPLVEVAAVSTVTPAKPARRREPNWSAIRGKAA